MTPDHSANGLFPRIPAIEVPAGSLPVLLVDQQEKKPLPISFPFETVHMATGDYSYRGGDFAIERKTVPDLVGCLTSDRKRFEAQLVRLKGHSFARLLIIGREADLAQGNYRSHLNPIAAVNSLRAFEARYVPVVWADTPEQGARLVEQWAFWHYRESLLKAKRLLCGKSASKNACSISSAH